MSLPYPTDRLTDKQEAYINCLLANPGWTRNRIGQEIGVSKSTVERWYGKAGMTDGSPCHNKDLFLSEIDRRLKQQWSDARALAQTRMIELVDEKDYRACEFVLKSNGIGDTSKVKVDANVNATVDIVNVEIE